MTHTTTTTTAAAPLHVSNPHPNVLLLLLNTPATLNCLTPTLITSLISHLQSANHDSTSCIIITTPHPNFCSGADITTLSTLTPPSAYLSTYLADLKSAFANCRKPIIAGVPGLALGGGAELALLCDIIYASDTAKFAFPEVSLGTIPGCGGTQALIAAVGRARAYEMVLLGERVDAKEALSRGMVAKVVGSDQLLEQCLKSAKTIAERDLMPVVMAKQALKASEGTGNNSSALESALYHLSFSGEVFKEKTSEFVQRKKEKKERKMREMREQQGVSNGD